MAVVAQTEQLPVQEARRQDSAAWDVLFKRYQMPLYVYVFELVHDEQGSLDIVQETFISASRNISGLREDSRFGSWLFGIAHQKCILRWRRDNRAEAALQEFGATPIEFEEQPDDILIRKEQEAEFMNLLNDLPLAQRSVLLLRFVEDFSIEEIASITGVAPGTVKSRLHHAKAAIRKLLEAKES